MTKATDIKVNGNGDIVGGHFCKCPCNQIITSKAIYKPGHDAAHVSHLLFTIIEHGEFDMQKSYAKELPSEALQAKFYRAVANYLAKKAPKVKAEEPIATVVEEPEGEGFVEGEIKIGRWTYPTRTWEGGIVERNEKRDGSGAWIAIG